MPKSILIEPPTPEPLRFWKPDKPYGFLSNFAGGMPFLDKDGTWWSTSEHFYQAQKHLPHNAPYAWLIHQARSPKEAASLGRGGELRSDWETVKVECMKWALWNKFTQNRQACSQLLATGDAQLIEASPWDDYWGVGRHGAGLNMLGVLLMQLRARLRNREAGDGA